MIVYNLTESPLEFRGKVLPSSGGSLEFPELDVFISNRDKEMARSGVISFGQLPDAWRAKKMRKTALVQATKPATLANGLRELPVVDTPPIDAYAEEPPEKVEKVEKRSRR